MATLGPASWNRIGEMILAGVDVFRVNFSHTDVRNPEHVAQVQRILLDIRVASRVLGIPVAVLGDLCGPKVRCNAMAGDPLDLVEGATVRLLASTEPCTPGVIRTNIFTLVGQLEVGHTVLLDDGNLSMQVCARLSPTEVQCTVLIGGKLKGKKGLNVPELRLDISPLTEKDKADAAFILSCGDGFDYVALSFVQKAADVIELREFMRANAPDRKFFPLIVSKIEKPQALDDIEAIGAATDAFMVARGDLGIECALERVPHIQKKLIALANALGKPVITATQMLEVRLLLRLELFW